MTTGIAKFDDGGFGGSSRGLTSIVVGCGGQAIICFGGPMIM
jgi:hypothetical protein